MVPTKALGGTTSSGHTCAVTPGDRAYCWGGNPHGELGNDTQVRSALPVPVS